MKRIIGFAIIMAILGAILWVGITMTPMVKVYWWEVLGVLGGSIVVSLFFILGLNWAFGLGNGKDE